MLNNTILKFLLKIFFNFNIQNKLIYSFNIFIPKFISNIKKNNILKFFKMNCFNIFNLRNKLNYNKSNRNLLNNKKKTGKARLSSSSSHTLRKGIVWCGLRKLPIHKQKLTKTLLNFLIIYKKNQMSFMPLEIIKFMYNLNITNSNLINFNKQNNVFVNFINNYIYSINKQTPLNIIY